jgi:hypothetical protein
LWSAPDLGASPTPHTRTPPWLAAYPVARAASYCCKTLRALSRETACVATAAAAPLLPLFTPSSVPVREAGDSTCPTLFTKSSFFRARILHPLSGIPRRCQESQMAMHRSMESKYNRRFCRHTVPTIINESPDHTRRRTIRHTGTHNQFCLFQQSSKTRSHSIRIADTNSYCNIFLL